ncbi:hypothetical protein [Pseudomonas sp. D3-10]|uniref:hypothetical protein n=1 Tax=unclassified Pseudomonas TaxID=196821 RepID=UPI003DA92CD3
MKVVKLLVVAIAVSGLFGCMSADMVSSPSTSSGYAPINEGSRSGVVKYLNDGAPYVRKQRRQDAYKQMHEACKGNYRIDAEGANAEGGSVINIGTSSFWAQSNYWYIQFSCA